MSSARPSPSRRRAAVAAALATSLAVPASVALAVPAAADVSVDAPVVIDEVYGGGGNSGAAFNQDFIELYNPTAEPVSLDGWSVQYASATGTWANGAQTNLTGSIPAGGSYLVAEAMGSNTALPALPTPDATGTIAMSGTGAKVALVSTTTRLSCAGAACATTDDVVDLVGWGATANAFAGSGPAPATTNATSVSRDADHTNTADNAADFTASTPMPTNGGTDPDPDPTPTPTPGDVTPIAEIQGTGAASPLVGRTVTTRGVVTAAYPTGGFNGVYLQTAGTGGTTDATPGASDGVFVFSSTAARELRVGQHVEVTGVVAEFNGLTEVNAASWSVLAEPAEVEPFEAAWPGTEAEREALEGMLLAPQGDFTVTDNYDTNFYGTIGLAAGTTPLVQPTTVARPGSAEAQAQAADNAARAVLLDDGATTNYNSTANKSKPLPWLTGSAPLRVGAAVTFTTPVVLDYRFDAWSFQPLAELTPAVAETVQPATFENTREARPQDVGGNLTVGTFNVLNYFTTTGDELTGCIYFTDRTGDPVTVDEGCDARGAAEDEDLERQEAKIVAAISALGADVVALEEIENSIHFLGKPRDQALSDLVDALNEHDGAGTWAYVPSPSVVPAQAEEDVIRNAFIYRTTSAEPVGESRILLDEVNFGNAREPLAQVFQAADGVDGDASDDVVVITNHFKSKGSAGPWPGDQDTGDGQGASNESRVRQARALVEFADDVAADAGTDRVLLVGDFNAYEQEDPIQELTEAGYTDLGPATGEYSYSFDGMVGSLDHVLASPAAAEVVTGADIWNINAYEPVANEYSRYNYNATILYDSTPFRSSDHDPFLVGLELTAADDGVAEIDLVAINDFHGRIDANTVAFAGTVEQLRAANPDGTAFVSAGDNVGASLFASALQQDQPTIDVLNALDLATSAVGNHELDQGFADLTDRIEPEADWTYTAANVYDAETGEPVLPGYDVVTIDGVEVGFVGAVTQETPTLVTPAGIEGLEFGDPVEAINRVTDDLLDGDAGNGEANLVVALLHEGAQAGTPDGSTLEEEVAAGGVFARVVDETDPRVAAIFTGHTHKRYAWDAPVPGADGRTRPIVQTGNYGEFLGHVSLTVDTETFEVTDYAAENVARTTTPAAELIATYPRVAQVDGIVDAALAEAERIGAQPVGEVTADITTAFAGGSYVDGVWTGGTRDDRASESALGNLVADALRDTLADDSRGGADIGVVNPGGLRSELFHDEDGVITYAEANSVLPFVNNLWTVTLTGAQLDELLEQQWQTDANGNRPSRPYLALGLSDNVSYTVRTADPLATPGDNVTSITVDGVPVDPDADYRIATFSFLATGGDNFRVFLDGTNPRDSGLVDRDAWIAYLQANSPVSPSFARTRTVVPKLPDGPVAAGSELALDVAGLDLTSLGAPRNTSASVSIVPVGSQDAVPLGEVQVSDGVAPVAVTVPASTPPGEYLLQVVAEPSGTTATLPLTIEEAAPAYPEWDRSTVYTAGDRVTHEDRIFEALWWTRGAEPGTSPWGAWAEVGSDVETPSGTYQAWTDSWVYQGGEVVAHDGHLWQARWYTRNQEPGASPWGPWRDLGAF